MRGGRGQCILNFVATYEEKEKGVAKTRVQSMQDAESPVLSWGHRDQENVCEQRRCPNLAVRALLVCASARGSRPSPLVAGVHEQRRQVSG